MNMPIKIGELAKRTGATVETIRYTKKSDYCQSRFAALVTIVYIMISTWSGYNLSCIAVHLI